jgi:hypothetical protein
MKEQNKKSNQIKHEQLGMSYGKARNILNKNIMFSLMQKCKMDRCFQCGGKIKSVDDLSVEHKIPYLYSENPVELFFDLDNIAFSHISCNSASARYKYCPALESGVGTSGYRGVRLNSKEKSKKYSAKITINKKDIFIASGNDPRLLAELYDKKAIELLGDRAITNKKLGLL